MRINKKCKYNASNRRRNPYTKRVIFWPITQIIWFYFFSTALLQTKFLLLKYRDDLLRQFSYFWLNFCVKQDKNDSTVPHAI